MCIVMILCLCYGCEEFVFICMLNIALMGPCGFSGWIPEAICMLFCSWYLFRYVEDGCGCLENG